MAMTPRRRDLMLRVMDGVPGLAPVLWHIDHMYRCDEVLNWLSRHGYTGKKLEAWIRESNEGSILRTMSAVLKELDGEKEQRGVFAGRDFITNRPR
jgi:hypothetical protein